VAISYLERPWESVLMHFMLSFPFSNGFNTNMVVHWFNKMAHFIPIANILIAQETRILFFVNVFKHHGLVQIIISYRNPKFTSKFWWALLKRVELKLKMKKSF
jgi:hypothetical protein